MIRKSAVAISLLLVVVSFRINALGLGEIDMLSALNEPMQATIGLTSAAGVDPSQINIGLASREAHERLGLTRDKNVANLRFEVGKDSRGKPVINISSIEPIREPFLEFLLEMEWDNGRMVREYTVLVDPPVTMAAAPVEPVAPVTRAPEVAPAFSEPVVRAAPAPRPPVATYAPAPSQRAGTTYGAVRRDESLWSIAKRIRPDNSISIQQMMLALLKANPQAFPDGNINNMKAGSILTIPERDVMLEWSREQARAEAGRQYNEWLDKRSGGRRAASRTEDTEERAFEAPVREVVEVAETGSQLKLTPPQGIPGEGSAISSSDGVLSEGMSGVEEGLRQELALAAEEVEASRAESSELRSRVLELEEQIQKMQRLLELKSDALAGLQQQLGIEPEATVPGEGQLGGDEDMASDAAGEQETVAAMESVSETVVPDEPLADADAGSGGAVAGLLDKAGGIFDKLTSKPLYTGLGALAALLLGGFIWGGMRKQSATGLEDVPATAKDMLADTTSGVVEESSVDDSFDDVVSQSFDDAEVDMQETSGEESNDPITEAEVYLAYGRVHQAEDVLQAALLEDPDNLTIRAKLLEVYHAEGNVAAFNQAAAEYREMNPGNDGQWDKIATLGYELSPGNELYSASVNAAGDGGSSDDFEMDLSGMDDIASADEAARPAEDLGLDMETESGETEQPAEPLEFTLDETEEESAQGEGLLASTDEAATKLDLARAYIDMEDPEGARSILQEVIAEGSAEQISEAESLIEKLV